MQVCGQTLILVDCDATVSDVNQKIIKSTLKYMMYHAPKDRAFCINTYSHTLDKPEEYVTDTNDLVCSTELLEFEPKDSNLTDVLCEVLSDWKESDFACRDIVVFTDGLEGAATEYENEELYYLIDNTSYPIYIVDLVQEGNASAKKHLSAISTTSGGKLFYSEYPGDDAEVDKFLSDSIYAQMNEWSNAEWRKYEQENNSANDDSELDSADTGDQIKDSDKKNDLENVDEKNLDVNEDELVEEISESIVYEEDKEVFYERPSIVLGILGVAMALIIGGIAISLLIMKRRKQNIKEDEEIKEIVKNNTCPQELFIDDGFTTMLNSMDDEGTRLLVEVTHKIELVDVDNSDNKKVICVDDPVCVGRSSSFCNLALEDDSVSKRHCEFSYSMGEYRVRDLGSSNGTYLNDERVDEITIKTGDRVKIGRSTYKVKCYE